MESGFIQTIMANFLISILAGYSARYFIKQFIPLFIQRNFCGSDRCKVDLLFYIRFNII